MNRACKLMKNENGLYDIVITDGPIPVAEVRNVTFQRAIVEMENFMHTKERAE